MKIEGLENLRNTKTIVIDREDGRKVTVQIKSIGPRFHPDFMERNPQPAPPVELAREGRKPVRDEKGKAVYITRDDDPKYLAALNMYFLLSAVATICEGSDFAASGITLEASNDQKHTAPMAYYEAVFTELDDFGFTQGDLRQWGEAINEISGIGQKEVEAGEQLFQK